VPNQIVVAVFAKLNVYGFGPVEARFAELLSILENEGATNLGGSGRAAEFVGIGRG
jgi:hypothetical protein